MTKGAPTSTGGINNATILCDILGTPLVLDPPREQYLHGWGDKCLDAKPIVCSWTLTVHDTTGKPTALTFDLVHGSSPLIVGMDVRKYCDTFNRGEQKYVRMQRPFDKRESTLYTYIVPDDSRLRLDIAPHPLSKVSTLLGNIQTSVKRTPLVFSKWIHRYTHATEAETLSLCKDAEILTPALESAIKEVCGACEVCAKNGRPKSSRKVSLTHVNQEFNQEIQVDFLFVYISGKKYCILIITDTGTGYTELSIAADRSMSTIILLLETEWICHRGAPAAFSADDEYNKSALRTYLSTHGIEFKPRPARRHNKLGVVERKNGVVKTILGKLTDESNQTPPEVLISRTAFLSNLFSGNRLLSSFELVRGYSPSFVGTPARCVSEDLLQAHREQVATRTLQRLLHSRAPDVVRKDMFHPGDPVWIFYKTTKQNEKVEWVRATVVSAEDHILIARRSQRGPPMRVAYEDVCFAPRSQLTTELLSSSLEDDPNAAIVASQMDDDSNAVEYNTPDPSQSRLVDDDPPPAPMLVDDDPPPEPMHTDRVPTTSLPVPAPPTEQPPPPLRLKLHLRDNPTLMARTDSDSVRPDSGEKDIGEYARRIEEPHTPTPATTLTRDTSRELEEIYEEIGAKQVTASKLSFAPPWILKNALESEHASNWEKAYIEIPDKEVPRDANVITSHVVYRVKTDEDGSRLMKARIVPHGNHDDEKDEVRKDSSNAPLFVVRLLLSLVTFLGFRNGTADIKGAFLQSGPIDRDVYIRPPREWPTVRGMLWKLRKLPYGIANAGRQWQKVVEEWMLTEGGLQRVCGISQLFVKRDTHGSICLLVAKVTDDFLLGGSVGEMQLFVDNLQKRFIVGKIVINQKIHFDGCEITQEGDGSICMSMFRYLETEAYLEQGGSNVPRKLPAAS